MPASPTALTVRHNSMRWRSWPGWLDPWRTFHRCPGKRLHPVFRDYIGSLRFDWAQSSKSQWFLRTSQDSYLTHNNLVQQATLLSTGLTTHNNYFNTVISNIYAFSPTWVGTFVFDASELHLTQTRTSTLGFALQFPFSLTSLTVSGHETFGDNQFATPITAFPRLRNQEKYQLRYDISRATGDHSLKFGVNFIHEPVLSGALSSNSEVLYTLPNDPTFWIQSPAIWRHSARFCRAIRLCLPSLYARTPFTRLQGTAPFRRTCRDSGYMPRIPGESHATSRSIMGCATKPLSASSPPRD